MYVLLKRGIPYSLKAINQENPTFQTQLFQDFKFFFSCSHEFLQAGRKGSEQEDFLVLGSCSNDFSFSMPQMEVCWFYVQ